MAWTECSGLEEGDVSNRICPQRDAAAAGTLDSSEPLLVLEVFSAWFPEFIVQAVSSFSFLTHFDAITKGVIEVGDIVFFVSLILFWLFANAVIIETRKAD